MDMLFTFFQKMENHNWNQNRVLRRIFVPKREEVVGGWRRLHNEELHNLYTSPKIIRVIKSRRIRWAEHLTRMGEMRNAYSIFFGKPERKGPLGKHRRRWEDNIRVYLREVGLELWIGCIWLRTGTSGGPL
jgi:hypothetical protein